MAYLARALSPTGGLAAFVSNTMSYRALASRYQSELSKHDDATAERFSQFYQTHMVDEKKQMIVLKDLNMSREEFTKMLEYKEDVDRMTQPLLLTFACGGLSLVGLPLWANAVHKLPSTFFTTEEEIREAGKIRDQEVHIKYAAQAGHVQSRYLEFYLNGESKFNEAFDSISNGFAGKKNPAAIRKFGQAVAKQDTTSLKWVSSCVSSFMRGGEHYDASAFLGKPFLFHNTYSLGARLVDHYRGLLQEDVLIQRDGVAQLSDLELYKICNRRLIARWEEELTRVQLESRLNDWFTLTEVKEGEEKIPIRVLLTYQSSFFRDPGFLDKTLESLDEDVNPSALTWAKDAFERRVEFETGPLAEQVKAHIEGVQQREKELLADRKKYLEQQ